MTRPLRIVVPEVPMHLVQRGNNRCNIVRDRRDCRFLLSCLREACEQHRCAVHAYVLMTNHLHVMLTPHTEDGPAKVMQAVGTRYVPHFNQRYERVGTLWQGRYRAALIDSERYFLVCARYIELNPVRAGLVNDPGDYEWSSYRCNALGHPDPLVQEHPLFESLGTTPADRCRAYAQMFEGLIDQTTLGMLRDATNKGRRLAAGA